MRTLADRLRSHGAAAGQLYGVLLRGMADDWERHGIVRTLFDGWEDAPAAAFVQLRALAGLHRLVLTGRAPELQRFYPTAGGTAAPDEAWPVTRRVIARYLDELRASLHVAPQTNEPGRAAALLVGLCEAVGLSGLPDLRLFEPGASGGLNLLVDRFRIGTVPRAESPSRPAEHQWFGPTESALQLPGAIVGAVTPTGYRIIERLGCDVSPVDVATEAGRLRLRSFVWPFQAERHRRLSAALRIAEAHPIAVDRHSAALWLPSRLRSAPAPGVLTVVWHSVTRQYWPAAETRAVRAAIVAAGSRMPLAHLALEHPHADVTAELSLSLYRPGRPATHRVLADVDKQGGTVVLRPRCD